MNDKVYNSTVFRRMAVGDRIRYLMEVREIKQTELSAKIGIGQAAISNLITGASRLPAAPTLLAIARELNVNPQWVLDGEGDPFAWAPITEPAQVELLNLYRAMPPSARESLLTVARSMAPHVKKPQL